MEVLGVYIQSSFSGSLSEVNMRFQWSQFVLVYPRWAPVEGQEHKERIYIAAFRRRPLALNNSDSYLASDKSQCILTHDCRKRSVCVGVTSVLGWSIMKISIDTNIDTVTVRCTNMQKHTNQQICVLHTSMSRRVINTWLKTHTHE